MFYAIITNMKNKIKLKDLKSYNGNLEFGFSSLSDTFMTKIKGEGNYQCTNSGDCTKGTHNVCENTGTCFMQ